MRCQIGLWSCGGALHLSSISPRYGPAVAVKVLIDPFVRESRLRKTLYGHHLSCLPIFQVLLFFCRQSCPQKLDSSKHGARARRREMPSIQEESRSEPLAQPVNLHKTCCSLILLELMRDCHLQTSLLSSCPRWLHSLRCA